uniref:Uncharacterized protein n=1 Tax=Nelumbo nucifera TaxID=4432 RepID=A0A822ZIP7_NELNU|nr:TPA_asm: hypothetical protein HUJ06_004214 [Nelumbo nucifera]
MPMSTMSVINLLNRLKVKEVGAVKEQVVDFGFNEGLALVKASMKSTTVLTDIFIEKKELCFGP